MHTRGYFRIHHGSSRRLVVAAAAFALVAGALPVLDGVIPGTTAAVARADDVTASQNLLRDGWDDAEPNMGPSVVPSFVQRWDQTIAGQDYAQPLVLGSTVIIATETDQVYGLNAGTGAYEWHTSLGSPYDLAADPTFKDTGCTDLTPDIGVTGTPAYDDSSGGTGDIYMFANILTGGSPEYYMVRMDPTTGKVLLKTPITGHPSNDSHVTFSAKYNMERPGVLIMGGSVYGAFASHCDTKPYDGYVVRVDDSGTPTSGALWSDESGVTYDEAGIWQGGGGIMSDGPGRIFVTSGNGVSPAKGPGTSPPGQLAESVIRLAVNSKNGSLSAQDFFSPAIAPSWDAADMDYGAGGPVGVPFTVAGDNTLEQAGKNGQIWLLNRDGLGGREQGPGSTDNPEFVGKAYGGEWGHAAVFGDTAATQANAGTTPTDNDFLFYVGKDDVMRVFRFAVTSSNKPWLTNLANSSLTYGYTSGSPVVTSNGDDPSSAVIWEINAPNTTGTTGEGSVLEAYALGNVASNGSTPSSCSSAKPCTLDNIWHSGTFDSAKFYIPATSQGWVYVGTRDGHVMAFAAPSAPAPASETTAALPRTAVGTTSSQAVSVAATKTVTFTGVSASTSVSNATTAASQFATGQVSEIKAGTSTSVPVTFPVTLAKGDKLSVQTKFTPAAPGGVNGTLSLSTSSTAFPIISVPLTGEGIHDGLYATPSAQKFPWAPDWPVAIPVPLGIQKPETVDISNFGTTTQTVTAVTPPSAPFIASNLPVVGTKITPGASVSVQVTYVPTRTGPATGSFTIVGSSGQKVVVTLSAVATAADSQLTPNEPVVNFGNVSLGKRVVAYVQITNSGNTESVVQRTSAVAAPFGAPLKPPARMSFNPDDDMILPVTFTPTKKGMFTTQYRVRWRDVNGEHTLTVILTGVAV
jgi:hypothetical protein